MYLRIACALLILSAGCSQSETEIGSEMRQNQTQPEIAANQLAVIKEAEQFNQELSSLNQQAKENEAAFQFTEAAELWEQVHQLVGKRFGEDSWQAFNAKIARFSALKKSNFNDDQIADLRKISSLLSQAKSNLENRQFEQSLQDSQEITDLSRQLYGENSVEFGQSLIQTAMMESRSGKYEVATRQFHQAIEILRQHSFGDHPEMEMAHAGLASAYTQQAKLSPAAANQKEATRIAGMIWGKESLDFAVQANQLGVIYHRAGNLDVAFEILDRAKAIREKLLGTDHAIYAHSCLNLGALMLDLERPDNAEVYLKKAMEIFDRDFGTDQALTNRARSHLATIYMLRKKPDQAEPLLKSVAESLPAGSEDQISHQYRLSIAYAKQGKYDLAKPLLEETIKQQKEQFGSSDRRTINSLRAYALLLERTHQSDAANTVKEHLNRVATQVDTQDFQKRY